MILGFAHITKNVPYHRQGRAVANPPAKLPLMARHAMMHWLYLSGWNQIVTEGIEYDTGVVEQPSRLSLDEGRIVVSARDRGSEIGFFDGMGLAEVEDGLVQLKSHIPAWSVRVAVRSDPEAPIDPPLDVAGYAALAFYCSDVKADRDRAIAAGGRSPTVPFDITLERKMKIIMLRSPEGTIIELIEVQPHD